MRSWLKVGGNTKFRLLIMLLVAIMVLSGGLAYAAYSKSIPSHVRIIQPAPPAPTIALYFFQDEKCTQVATLVEWSDMLQGASLTKDMFYVRNGSDIAVTVTGTSSLPANIGTLTITFKKGPTYESLVQLTVGEVVKVRGELTIKAVAPLGDVNFNIILGAQA